MKYHSQLLKKYISIDDSRENIAQKFILKTAEIEEITERKIPDSIVIGKVLEVWKHLDADKLNIAKVDCGAKGTFQIICGGVNLAADQLVPVALVGTPFPQANIVIEKRTMRGVDSEGMICSKEELQIYEDLGTHEIWDLKKDLELTEEDIGIPLREKFPWLEATILEVDNKNMTNRPDLTGHFGAAVELNAMYPDSQIKYNKVKEYLESFKHTEILNVLSHTESKLSRQVLGQSESLNAYIALEINKVKIQKSDFFARLQLLDLGSHPISNWVDFSNLFMNISGLPVHFFDADKIQGDLIIRDAKEGEKFIDLFEKEHILQSTDLVIADEHKILALAGIVGGLESGISEKTQNILVELANFDPVTIRKTGMRLGLRTDAELRFEKNINPLYSLYTLLFFLDELKFYRKGLGDFKVSGLGYYLNPKLNITAKKAIDLDYPTLQNFIFGKQAVDFKPQAQKILSDLGFEHAGDTVFVPFWRSPEDITIPEDVAEEIARIWGYENITAEPILAEIKDQKMGPLVQITRVLEEILVRELHFDQSETYPWVSATQLELFAKNLEHQLQLKNPLNPETPYLRDGMVYNLLENVAKNSKFFDEIKIYDIGHIRPSGSATAPETMIDPRYAQYYLGEGNELGMLYYQKSLSNWDDDPFLKLKGALDHLLVKLEIKGKIDIQKTDQDAFHPQKQLNIILRNGPKPLVIGHLATLHPLLLKHYKFPEQSQVVYAKFNIDALSQLLYSQETSQSYETLQDQILWRDLSFLLPKTADFSQLIQTLEKIRAIESVKVFDLYQGDNLAADQKSISIQIKIKGEGNMTTEQINEVMNQAIEKAAGVGAVLRG